MNLYVITGTSRGLGRALADELAGNAENFVVEMGRATPAQNARNTLLEADFADKNSVTRAFAALGVLLQGRHFSFAALINNAGVVLPVARFDALDPAALEINFAVNVTAPILAAGAFATLTRGMADQRLIVGISSGAAKRAVRGWTAYCAAKCALEMATRVMAAEAEASDPGLVICTLAPGVIDTGMQSAIRAIPEGAFPEVARFREMKESGALRDATAVARDIISVLQPTTGQAILLNGGNHDIREINHA